MIDDTEATCDAFLGGRLRLWQPRLGFRAATDSVFLAAACPAKAGEHVLELGCGVGVVARCLMERVDGVHVTGVELQADYVALARKNGVDVVEADLTNLPPAILEMNFDHVVANPPFFGVGTAASDKGRDVANREATPLDAWIRTAYARLKPQGWLTLIHSVGRLPDVLRAMDGFGTITALPLASRHGRPAGRVVLRARKGARGPFQLLSPFLVHEGERHSTDGDDYSATARAVLRDGAALPFD